MGKSTRLAPIKVDKRTMRSPENKRPGENATAVLEDQVRFLLLLQRAAEASLEEGGAPPALLRESQGVARAIATMLAEIRQQDRHLRDAVRALTPKERLSLIGDYIRELAPDDIVAFRSILDEIDHGRSILS